jgi:hypothetical protein
MPSRHEPQPSDEWSFVPQDDEVVTDEPVTPSAETAAMHVEQPTTPAEDAGRADVALGDDAGEPRSNFEDEEPEDTVADAQAPEGDEEPDLEKILESQNYAFEDEDDLSEGASDGP